VALTLVISTWTPGSTSSKPMSQVRNLIRTDVEHFEFEVDAWIRKIANPLSLFVVDMSEISGIFARSGQAKSSRFLQCVGEQLLSICEESDQVYRIGDSAFGVLLSGVESMVHQQMAAEKISRLQKDAIREVDARFNTPVYMGVSSHPEHANDAVELIHTARIALESARIHRKPYTIYSADTTSTIVTKWNLQEELAAAIDANQLQLHYQPKIDITTGRPAGAEALLRWTNEANTAVPPNIFIPVARDIGLMSDLTRYVITTALREAAEWPDLGYRHNVSVNIESSLLQEIDMNDVVSSSLSIFGSDNCDLTLEVTETALVADSKQGFRCLNDLRALGVGIAIDDFGSGESSISYFKDLPATELKIDKSLIHKMLDSDEDRNVVETIVMLAHRFNILVVAEGVETAGELEALKQMKCDFVQGHHFSKALPNDEFCEWLTKQE
jgi:EAL domain-containing protein (putative c-di-GMP-specific phosphodiesterase class I)/GGDEF domain-containing protein